MTTEVVEDAAEAVVDPAYPSEWGEDINKTAEDGACSAEEQKLREFTDFVEEEQQRADEVPDHSLYLPLSGTPPNEKELETSPDDQMTFEEGAKKVEGVDEQWQEVFDLAEIDSVEEMNDLIYRVSSFLVQDRQLLSKWISGVQ